MIYSKFPFIPRRVIRYGFQLDMSISTPANMITYLSDCDNADFTPAGMNYSTGTFSYGSWADAWFIQDLLPCMLGFDGNIKEILNKSNYTKTEDGLSSSITNSSFQGNAMVGLPTVWMKVDASNAIKPKFYFSNFKIDDTYFAFAHLDENGNIMPYTYYPIYNGTLVNSKIRSLSGYSVVASIANQTLHSYCRNNNLSGSNIWDMETGADWMLLNLLCFLIGRNTDCQDQFGQGYTNSTSDSVTINTGTMNDKGLFWGDNAGNYGVKVFGIENWWGNIWRSKLGIIFTGGILKVKMCRGTQDGSSVSDYNWTGSGYVNTEVTTTVAKSGCIQGIKANKYGLWPNDLNGSKVSTYIPDLVDMGYSGTYLCKVGGHMHYNSRQNAGPFRMGMDDNVNLSSVRLSCSICCKPLAA